MYGQGKPGSRRRPGAACDGAGPGHGRRRGRSKDCENSRGARTATRTLAALGAYVAQDIRDAEGLTRPLLRRAARHLALSRREPARRLGSAYLLLDPPDPAGPPQQVALIEMPGSSTLELISGTPAD